MKQKLLLVSALLLSGANAFAGGWNIPVPTTGVDPESGNQYYIMNVGSGQFLTNGKVWFSWNTTAALADNGQLSTLNETEGTWTIQRSDGKFTFISGPADGRGEMHVDGANATNWVFQKNGDTYHIMVDPNDATYGAAEKYKAPMCWGWLGQDENPVNAIIGNLDPSDPNNSCEWLFMDPDGYNAFKETHSAYKDAVQSLYLSKKLRKAIDEAKTKYPTLDFADEEAVYANADGTKTLKDLENAMASVQSKVNKAIADEAVMSATVEKPFDFSSRIINGDFSKTNSSDFIGTTPNAFNYGAAEFYNMNYDIHQDLKEMPNGVYVFALDGFYRVGSIEADYAAWKANNGYNAKFYIANMTEADTVYRYGNLNHLFDGAPTTQPAWVTEVHTAKENDSNVGSMRKTTQEGVDYYIPNSMYQFSLANANGLYKGSKIAMCVTEGRISVGLKKTVAVSTDWTIFDNFTLLYYGDGASAYAFLMEDYKSTAALPKDLLASKELTESYNQIVSEASATNYEEYLAAVKAIEEARALVDSNAVVWNKLKEITELAEELVNNQDYEGLTGDLSDYVDNAKDAMDLDDGLELTVEEIEEMIEEIKAEYESVKSQTKPGTKMTHLIVNNNFAQGDKGWTLYNPTKKTLAANASAKCAEAYDNADFNIYQDITGAPAGVYEISLQGFVRPSRDKEAWLKHFDKEGKPLEHPTDTLDAFIYMNDALNRLSSVFTFQSYTKDSLYKGTGFWSDDLEYAPEGDTVVYKSTYSYPNDMASAGIAFREGAYVTSAFGLVAEGDTMRIGMKGSIAGPNWAIFTNFELTYQGFLPEYVRPMLEAKLAELNINNGGEEDPQTIGANILAAATAAKQVGEAALATGDGKKMYDALCEMLPTINKINASKSLFAKLMEAYEKLLKAYGDYAEARESVRSQAEALQAEIENNLVIEKSYNDEDVPAVIEQIEGIIAALAVPGNIEEATEEEPCEVTSLLVNPSFETGNLDGWTSENFQTQSNSSMAKVGTYYCERWHADLNLKISQQIKQKSAALPEGIYGISVCCAYTSVEEIGDLAYLYVADVDTTAFTSTDAMNPSRIEIKFYLHENDIITFGVNSQLTSTTWCVLDDFQLWYYGASTDGIETLEAKKSEKIVAIYDLNGIKVSGLKSGINLVRTMDAQGKLQTRKIIAK